jgi:hypothetical protein
MIAMAPDEAAPILADFAGKLNMEMSGKFWAPSTSLLIIYLPAPCSLLHPIQLCSIDSVKCRSAGQVVLLPSIGR